MTTRAAALIAAGSIAALLLAGTALIAVIAALGSVQGTLGIHSTGGPCLPSDFPSYANASRDLAFTVGNGVISTKSPASGKMAPPGYYLLVIVNSSGVPSVMPFIQIQ